MKKRNIVWGVLTLMWVMSLVAPLAAQASTVGLVDTKWYLVSYGTVGDETPVLPESGITIEFAGADRVNGFSGCNTYAGTYSIQGDSLHFTRMAGTLRACVDSSLTEQESTYLAALQSAGAFTLSADQLTIAYGDGQHLVFARALMLNGTQWQLVSLGAAADPTPVLSDTTVTLIFGDAGDVGGSGGCNTYGGSYSVSGSSITFDQIVSTLMACVDNGVQDQESAYFAALQSAVSFTLSSDQLVISYDEGQELVFVPVLSLEANLWHLVTLGGSPVLDAAPITLEFTGDNQASGSGGCNNYRGSYTLNGESLTFSPVLSTRMACVEEGVMEQESAYFLALQASVSYRLTADELIISNSDGQQHVFVPVLAEI